MQSRWILTTAVFFGLSRTRRLIFAILHVSTVVIIKKKHKKSPAEHIKQIKFQKETLQYFVYYLAATRAPKIMRNTVAWTTGLAFVLEKKKKQSMYKNLNCYNSIWTGSKEFRNEQGNLLKNLLFHQTCLGGIFASAAMKINKKDLWERWGCTVYSCNNIKKIIATFNT